MIKTVSCLFFISVMLTACANQNENRNNATSIFSHPLQEGKVKLVKVNSDRNLEDQTVYLNILWQMSKSKPHPRQAYPSISRIKELTGKDNRFIQVLVPNTPYSIIISNKASSAMIWDKDSAILWRVSGRPLNGNPHGSSLRSKNYDFWYFQPTNQKISLFFGDDSYGYKLHFDFSDKNDGLKFYSDEWTGF